MLELELSSRKEHITRFCCRQASNRMGQDCTNRLHCFDTPACTVASGTLGGRVQCTISVVILAGYGDLNTMLERASDLEIDYFCAEQTGGTLMINVVPPGSRKGRPAHACRSYICLSAGKAR